MIECFTCRTKMETQFSQKSYNHKEEYYYNYIFLKCPACGAKAEIYYDETGENIKEVLWEDAKR